MSEHTGFELRHDLASEPIYNIKAVAEATGLPPATLRAWERRYRALNPARTDSGYRLYSAQDIATLRWLKARVEEGLSIRHAMALLTRREGVEHITPEPDARADLGQGIHDTLQALLAALTDFSEPRADQIMEQAFAVYGPDLVCEQLIAPAMAIIGERWHQGKVSTATEHFASNYLRRKLDAVINASPRRDGGPLIVLACAPGDWHELGLLMLYLFLRRAGHHVVYLGQNVPADQFATEMRKLGPALVLASASTSETVPGLIEMSRSIERMDPPRPQFGFGGAIFNAQPELRERVHGTFLGESARLAVERVTALLAEHAESERGARIKVSLSPSTNS